MASRNRADAILGETQRRIHLADSKREIRVRREAALALVKYDATEAKRLAAEERARVRSAREATFTARQDATQEVNYVGRLLNVRARAAGLVLTSSVLSDTEIH